MAHNSKLGGEKSVGFPYKCCSFPGKYYFSISCQMENYQVRLQNGPVCKIGSCDW